MTSASYRSASSQISGSGARYPSIEKAPSVTTIRKRARALSFEQVLTGLSAPVYVTSAPGDPTTLYVVEQGGTIKIVKGGKVTGTFLDIHDRISSGEERGLLSVAFHPAYATNHRF